MAEEESQDISPVEHSDSLPVLRRAEDRLVSATVEEAETWLGVIERITNLNLRQQSQESQLLEQSLDADHRRDMNRSERDLDRYELLSKIGLSVLTTGVGVGFVFGGHTFVGFFMLGAGVYWLAPRFVRGFFGQISRRLGGGSANN